MSAKTDYLSAPSFDHLIIEDPEPSNFTRHCHNDYEILYVVSGEGKYYIEGVEYPICPNTLVMIRPYEFHYLIPNRDFLYERYVINFEREALIGSTSKLGFLDSDFSKPYGIYFPADKVTKEIPESLKEIKRTMEKYPGPIAGTMLKIDLSRIILILSELNTGAFTPPRCETITQIVDYVNRHFTEDLSLDIISAKFFVSKYYLCHAFHEHMGVSLFQYISNKRVAMAQQLLAKGESATDIAYQVGFQNYSTFYRAYKKQLGVSPVCTRNCK